MATFRADITRSVEPATANPALLGRAAEANARAVGTLTNLAGEMYKGYIAGEMANIEEQAANVAGEFFVSGQAAQQAARRIPAVEAARGTVFETQGPLLPAQQEGVEKQLSAFDSELTRLKSAVEGGMSNERYVSRIDSLTKSAIAKFPGLADQIRERVASVTGIPGADRWAQMSYVRDRFTPPKEGGSKAKTPEDMALQDIDEAAKAGMFGTREELLNIYRTDRATYDARMTGFKQVLSQQTQTKTLESFTNGLRNQGDLQADQQRATFAAVFSGALGTSVLTQAVQDKENTFGNTLDLMSKGDPAALDPTRFKVLVDLHNAQMRTNVEGARRQAYTTIDTYIANNPNISDAKRKELYADVDRATTLALGKYADDKGVGLSAMAAIFKTYRDKGLAEKAQLVDLAIKQQTAMQNNPMVMAYWAGGEARENLKRTNRSFYEFMVNQENELTSSIAGVRNDINSASQLATVQRTLLQSEQSTAAVPIDPTASPEVTRAAHQAQMATAVEVLKKSELLPTEVNTVGAALTTSTAYGANSQLLARDYRKIGDKILKLPQQDGAKITAAVSDSIVEAVGKIQTTKTSIEDKFKVKLTLGFNDAGEIVVMAPPRPEIPSQRRAMTMAEMQAAAAPVINTAYTQATAEFNKLLKPMLSNIVYGRAMLTTEIPKNVARDFAVVINGNQPYNGFFSMKGQSAEAPAAAAPATPAAPAQATPAAFTASAATQTTATFNTLGYPVRKPYESEDKYFKANPNVAGMATEDGAVILNPYSTLSDTEKQAVALNEAYRLYMRENKIVPKFELTEEQKKFFTGSEYANNPDAAKQTIVARILSGDPSAKATARQQAEAKKIADQQKQKPAASAAGGKRTASMADVARYAAEKKISVSDAVSQLEAEGVDVIGN